jgi:hypothetical protein
MKKQSNKEGTKGDRYMKDEKCKTIINSDEENETNGGPTTISERKLAANRANAQRSTGPRSQLGKSYSRLNSFKHGLLAKKVIFDGKEQLSNPELFELYEALCEQYGTGDLRIQILLDTLVVDYWRLRQAIELEVSWNKAPSFIADPNMPRILRYVTASRNSLMKNLALLSEAKQADETDPEEGKERTPVNLRADATQPVEPKYTEANREQPASDIGIPRLPI